jgi:hypothetical protein
MAIYLTGVYMSEKTRKEFEKVYKAAGRRLDAGKSCVRFKKLDDLPLDVVGRTIGEYSVDAFVEFTQRVRRKSNKKTSKKTSRE